MKKMIVSFHSFCTLTFGTALGGIGAGRQNLYLLGLGLLIGAIAIFQFEFDETREVQQ